MRFIKLLAVAISAVALFVAGFGLAFAPLPFDNRPDPIRHTKPHVAYAGVVTDEMRRFDPATIIRLQSASDFDARRQMLRNVAFGQSVIPDVRPDTVTRGVSHEDYAEMKNLASVDELIVVMRHSIASRIHHLIADDRINRLAIVHRGHGHDFSSLRQISTSLVAAGVDVLVIYMPLCGPNNRPILDHPFLGPVLLENHDHLIHIERPLEIFMLPVAAAMNHALAFFDYEKVLMTGSSGGGWTTDVYAAIDTRINVSFSVAGSLPIYLRRDADQGDYEQHLPEMLEAANYLEMYILASTPSRRHWQIFNENDPACFAGAGDRHKLYEATVDRMAQWDGGRFRAVSVPNRQHSYSAEAIKMIVQAIAH